MLMARFWQQLLRGSHDSVWRQRSASIFSSHCGRLRVLCGLLNHLEKHISYNKLLLLLFESSDQAFESQETSEIAVPCGIELLPKNQIALHIRYMLKHASARSVRNNKGAARLRSVPSRQPWCQQAAAARC